MDVLFAHNQTKAKAFLNNLEGKAPLFLCTIATTETGKIPGLSAAGANPDLPILLRPQTRNCCFWANANPSKASPSPPTASPPRFGHYFSVAFSRHSVLVVNGGVKVKPQIPYVDLGGNSGRDIRTGDSVDNVEEVIERAKVLGEQLAKASDYLVIGESIPGGTTTALGVLSALGVNAEGKVSSTLPLNPHSLKNDVVRAGLKAAGEKFGSLKNNPIKAVTCVGDPMMPALAGLVIGGSKYAPVLMAGGTQMTAVLAVINALEPKALSNVAVGTTRWVAKDQTSDIAGITSQFCDVPILAADLDFGASKFPGLRIYETGLVKEGVGAGGASIAAMAKSSGKITKDSLLKEIERNYASLMNLK
jgi:uncharacterized protein (TIGR00303 family)